MLAGKCLYLSLSCEGSLDCVLQMGEINDRGSVGQPVAPWLLAIEPFMSISPGTDCPGGAVPVCTQRGSREKG